LLKTVMVKIEDIYIPAARRSELDPNKVEEICNAVIEDVEQRPIQVRKGNGRLVLVKGINRLEARKALGDETIGAYMVSAQQH
jgi:hypothetical protein